MRPDLVVVLAPRLDDDLSLGPRPEPFEAQALVAELAVEALRRPILPRLAWIDQGGLDALVDDPLHFFFPLNSSDEKLNCVISNPKSVQSS